MYMWEMKSSVAATDVDTVCFTFSFSSETHNMFTKVSVTVCKTILV